MAYPLYLCYACIIFFFFLNWPFYKINIQEVTSFEPLHYGEDKNNFFTLFYF